MEVVLVSLPLKGDGRGMGEHLFITQIKGYIYLAPQGIVIMTTFRKIVCHNRGSLFMAVL
uniref:hypothetical protein n=1 Tax=Thermococcus sp. EXT9 TaxID=1197732 RepID=UPI0018682131|nr:hypothetical protein [Thermococcus sp. EXT9]